MDLFSDRSVVETNLRFVDIVGKKIHQAAKVNKSVGTNNLGELTAIYQAVKYYRDNIVDNQPEAKAILYTDSQYSLKCCTNWTSGLLDHYGRPKVCWVETWLKQSTDPNQWKTSKGTPVINANLIYQIYLIINQLPQLKLEHVRAHRGNYWNEYVDQLARGKLIELTDY